MPEPTSPAPHRYLLIEPYYRAERDLTHLFEPSALRTRAKTRYQFKDQRSVDRRILYDVRIRVPDGPAVQDYIVSLELLRERRFRAPSAPLQFRVVQMPGKQVSMRGQIALLSCSGVTYTRIILDEDVHWLGEKGVFLQQPKVVQLGQEIVKAIASAVSYRY